MREQQGGRCACCGDLLQGGREEHIDHCHTTGRVRGILCRACNLTLGNAKESTPRLLAAAAYLESRRGAK